MNNGRQLAWGLGIVGLTAALAVGCSNQDRATAEENLQKWQTNGPKTYVYVDDTQCFCVTLGPVRIVVTDDLVTSAVSQESGQTVTTAKTMTELLQNVVADAEAPRAVLRVAQAFRRRVAIGEHDAVDALRSERIDRHRGADCGIDAAGQSEHDALEAVLVDIVPEAKDAGLPVG